MMTQPKSEQDDFKALLEGEFANRSDDSLRRMRVKAWERFLELGLPTRKNEVYRYVKLRNLYSHAYESTPGVISPGLDSIASHIYRECKKSVLVFVNGRFQPRLSNLQALPEKTVLLDLNEASRTYGAFLMNQWTKSLKDETDAFAAANAALHQNAAFLYLPPKTVVEAPVQVLHVVDSGGQSLLMHPRLHLFAGAQSQIQLTAVHAVLSGEEYFVNQTAEFSIEEDAHVVYTQANSHPSAKAWHLDALRATLKRDSSLKTIAVTEGSQGMRNDYRVALAGENAEALLNGVWMLSRKSEAHTHVLVDHQAPYCRSFQLFKGVLNDFGHSSFEGKILVRQPAQKTEAFQLNKNLLLSEGANAESKPNLEIFADDVKASHGATVGQLDKEELFYMKARGFSENEAKNLLVYAFCKEVIDKIELPSLRQEVIKRSQSYTKV